MNCKYIQEHLKWYKKISPTYASQKFIDNILAIANEEFVNDVFYQKRISFYFFAFISSLHCLQILCNMHLFYIHCKSDRAFLSLEFIKFRIKDKVGAKCTPFYIN